MDLAYILGGKAYSFVRLGAENTATGEAGGCSYAGIALYSSLTRKTRKYDLPAA